MLDADFRGEISVGRISQKLIVGVCDDRRVSRRDVELIEQFADIGGVFKVNPSVKNVIFREKISNPKSVLRILRADDAQARKINRVESLPAGDECFENNVA